MNPSASLSLSDRFVMTLEGLYAAVAARVRSGAMTGMMILAICGRIRRAEGRVVRMLARFRAGWRPAVREVSGRAGRRAGRVAGSSGRIDLPRRFGWLLGLVPVQAAGLAEQLRHTLAEPEMRELLAAVPGARRALAPVCRMLAIEAAVLMPTPVGEEAPEPSAGAVDVFATARLPVGWPGLPPPAASPQAPDFRYFRDGSPPLGPPLVG